MFRFIRRHWLAYLIGVAVAIALGFGAAYVVGVVGSTPESQRAARDEGDAVDTVTQGEADDANDSLNTLSGDDAASEDASASTDTTTTDTATTE